MDWTIEKLQETLFAGLAEHNSKSRRKLPFQVDFKLDDETGKFKPYIVICTHYLDNEDDRLWMMLMPSEDSEEYINSKLEELSEWVKRNG